MYYNRLHELKADWTDIEPQLKDRADALAKAKGVESIVDFQIVTPGTLPFSDSSFDVVFSKDSMIHIHDKPASFSAQPWFSAHHDAQIVPGTSQVPTNAMIKRIM